MGIEFCYATETALVTPTLLQMGLPDQLYSITWILSPTLGFLMNPVIGSLSDRCRCFWGRRRPFILALCIGVIIGLTLFLSGEDIGMAMSDTDTKHTIGLIITMIGVVLLDYSADSCDSPSKAYMIDVCDQEDLDKGLNIRALLGGLGGAVGYILNSINWENTALSVIGDQAFIMFVFCLIVALICFVLTLTSVKETPLPSIRLPNNNTDEERKPLLDEGTNSRTVSIPIYKPLTGPDCAFSYDTLIRHSPRQTWFRNATSVDDIDGAGHMYSPQRVRVHSSHSIGSDVFSDVAISEQDLATITESENEPNQEMEEEEHMSALQVVVSIIKMPKEMRWLSITHLFSWSAVLTQFLFFTDYMGQVVYNGDPKADVGSPERIAYQDGVQMGCWGMVIFGVSVMILAVVLTKLSKYVSTYTIYVWGQVIFAVGMGLMAIFSDSVWITLLLCVTVGVQFVTVTTIPFSILAGYHESYRKMSSDPSRKRRGIGTDVACICSTNFLAQILVSAILGAIIDATDTELSIVLFGSVCAFIAAFLAATFVIYKVPVDGEDKAKEETNKSQGAQKQDQPSSPLNSSPKRFKAGNPNNGAV
ncbi:proton-associated sugar transporter A-like [Amphiura filiformis]|uniref:proton-associated sugar transporter A-like n=1 Tax=Amphiura filiformis TaxID=82378 RepID=UPI003B20D99E